MGTEQQELHERLQNLSAKLQGNEYEQIRKLLATVSESRATEARELQAQAIAYAWGWQDAGGAPRDTNVSVEFGWAYGLHAARYAAEEIGCRRNIQDSFRRFLAGEPIEH